MKALTLLLLSATIAFGAFAQENAPAVVVSTDKRVEITIPPTWTTLELNDVAEIEVGNEAEESYLIVLNEVKDDLHGWNLEKHSRVTLGRLISGLDFPTITGPKSLTLGGRPAVQYEVRGANDGRNILYFHTTIDGEALFCQILAWTIPSRAEAARPQLVKAIESFREKK
jgi:hypothetical protein